MSPLELEDDKDGVLRFLASHVPNIQRLDFWGHSVKTPKKKQANTDVTQMGPLVLMGISALFLGGGGLQRVKTPEYSNGAGDDSFTFGSKGLFSRANC